MAQIPNIGNQRGIDRDEGGVVSGELGITSGIDFVKNRYNLQKLSIKLYLKADSCPIL